MILTIAATNSTQSINRQLLSYACSLIVDADIEELDINDYEMPLYSMDREVAHGIPDEAYRFYRNIGAADALLISFAEHNGSYTAAYKNLYDWASRIDAKVYQNKPTVMLSTSPGPGGGANVLAAAVASAPFFGADLKASMSVPSFFDRFDATSGCLSDSDLANKLQVTLSYLAVDKWGAPRTPASRDIARIS